MKLTVKDLSEPTIVLVRAPHWACKKLDCDCDDQYQLEVDSKLGFAEELSFAEEVE